MIKRIIAKLAVATAMIVVFVPSAAASTLSTRWVVKSGDTVWKIAKALGVPVSTIVSNNHITNPAQITVGQILFVPQTGTHLVRVVSTKQQPSVVWTWTNSDRSANDAMKHRQINNISDDSYVFTSSGAVVDTGTKRSAQKLLHYARTHRVQVYATITNLKGGSFDSALAHTVLSSPPRRANLIKTSSTLLCGKGYTGIDVDIEQVKSAGASAFGSFVTDLSAQLHAVHKKLSVTVPGDDGSWWYAGYNLSTIGKAADVVPVMTYDDHWQGGSSGPIAPLPWDNQVLQYVTSKIPARKVLLGIGAYGYDWQVGSKQWAASVSMPDIYHLIRTKHIKPQWDSTNSVPYLQYTTPSGLDHTVYYENAASIRDKMTLVPKYGLAGIAFWRAGMESRSFFLAIKHS